QGAKPVHWCFDCGSALAEAEIEYQDKVSPAIDVLFRATDRQSLLNVFGVADPGGELGVPIWTTTPWTLPANQAVTLHAELDYQLLRGRWQGEYINVVIAADLRETVATRLALEQVTVLGQ